MLDLSGTRLPSGDVRRVILMDDSIVIGPGPLAHIRADQLPAPVVLYVRNGQLLARGPAPVFVNDQPMDEQAGIPMGARVRIGSMTMTATAEA